MQSVCSEVHNMALASGHWINKDIKGDPPCPRHGHALTLAGNIAFIFGGCAINIKDQQRKYFNDFYMLTVRLNNIATHLPFTIVTLSDLTWEAIPQNGCIPSHREGHSICVVKGKIFLFGGRWQLNTEECLPGMHCFDIESLTWEKLQLNGIAPCTLYHSTALVGDKIFVFGGIQNGEVSNDLFMFSTVSLTWTPVKTTGMTPAPRHSHTFAAVGELLYLFGGTAGENVYYKDVHVLDTVTLTWSQCDIKGEAPCGRGSHTFTPHHDKDIYMFGGSFTCQESSETILNDVVKLSLAKMKWKVPLYVGISPARRHNHVAFILHSHLYIFGGVSEEEEFSDIRVMKLINPSDRQPIMKEIFSEFGIHEVINRFSPTKVPKVRYELTDLASTTRMDSPPQMPVPESRDMSSIHKQAVEMITRAFSTLDTEFQNLNTEKTELNQARITFQKEKDAYDKQYRSQQQELQEMLEKHKAQNEAWFKARAEENDRERQELCRQRAELLQEQAKLHEEQKGLQKRSQQLLSIMQQFKGM